MMSRNILKNNIIVLNQDYDPNFWYDNSENIKVE